MAKSRARQSTAAEPAATIDYSKDEFLQRIVEATKGPQGFMFADIDEVKQYAGAAGLVEVNIDMKNEAGGVAVRATAKGIALFDTVSDPVPANPFPVAAPAPVATPEASKGAFPLVSGVPLPEIQGRGFKPRESIYPFEKMEVGHSFFLADAVEDGKTISAVTKYASAVSAANQKHSRPDPSGATKPGRKEGTQIPIKVYDRQFVIRTVADGAPWGKSGVKGAGIWRVK